jgi:FkbM family methyltransferase
MRGAPAASSTIIEMLRLSMPLLRVVKPLLIRTAYRPGTVRTILLGPGRGLKYHVFSDFGMAPVYGGWEPETQRFMQEAVGWGDVVYDVGANRGIHSLMLSRLVGATGHLYAFEPVPAIRADLERNVALNRISNITILDLALSDTVGSTEFSLAQPDGAGHLAVSGAPTGRTISVRTTSLDEFVFGDGNPPPKLIKLDVEGSEAMVLAGGTRVLAAFHPLLIVDHHSPDCDAIVEAILRETGYRIYPVSNQACELATGSAWRDSRNRWVPIVARAS